MMRFKKQFFFLFSFLFKIPVILSQQEISNKNVSEQSFFSSFSFFFLSFSLTWEKCQSHRTDTCSSVHSINLIIAEIEPFSFFFFFFFFFLNTYNFPIFMNCGRKTVWVVLIFDGLSIIQFLYLLFTGEWPSRSRLNSVYCSDAVFCLN